MRDTLENYKDSGDAQDFKDALITLDNTGLATRCKGGRFIIKGYMCIHCDADPSMDPCQAPKLKTRVR
jgi:hypothetical protein